MKNKQNTINVMRNALLVISTEITAGFAKELAQDPMARRPRGCGLTVVQDSDGYTQGQTGIRFECRALAIGNKVGAQLTPQASRPATPKEIAKCIDELSPSLVLATLARAAGRVSDKMRQAEQEELNKANLAAGVASYKAAMAEQGEEEEEEETTTEE